MKAENVGFLDFFRKAVCDLRNQIDEIDEVLLRLINCRLRLVENIGQIKKELGNEVIDETREIEILYRLGLLNLGPLEVSEVYDIFKKIIKTSRSVQRKTRVAYVGKWASIPHMIILKYLKTRSIRCVSVSSNFAVLREIEKGNCKYGLILLKDNKRQLANYFLNNFSNTNFEIFEKCSPRIGYELASCNSSLRSLDSIFICYDLTLLCRVQLRKYLPNAEIIECSSIENAVMRSFREKNSAVVLFEGMAELFGLRILFSKLGNFAFSHGRYFLVCRKKSC